MNASTIVALALAAVAVVAVICYGCAWCMSRGRGITDELLTVAVIALIASCATAPDAAEKKPVSIEVQP